MGIGLAISKHIVQMHGGEICAESIPGGETLFKVSIPLGDSHFSEEDFKKENSDDTTLTDIEPAVDYKNCGNVSQFSTVDREHTVLIVDDNESLRNYLAMLLSSRYNVIVAENGQQGYERAIADQPDVIISDILMPKMNGVELCARIKENEDTSHIPVTDPVKAIVGMAYRVEKVLPFFFAQESFFHDAFPPFLCRAARRGRITRRMMMISAISMIVPVRSQLILPLSASFRQRLNATE